MLEAPSILAMPLLAAVVDLSHRAGHAVFHRRNSAARATSFFKSSCSSFTASASASPSSARTTSGAARRATFDEAWDEGRRKAGGILIATIGFYFLFYVAGYIGGFSGSPIVQIALELIVAFLLIYTIPAAAIGGMPGNFAIGASFRAVKANVPAAIVLAVVFVVLWGCCRSSW